MDAGIRPRKLAWNRQVLRTFEQGIFQIALPFKALAKVLQSPFQLLEDIPVLASPVEEVAHLFGGSAHFQRTLGISIGALVEALSRSPGALRILQGRRLNSAANWWRL